MYRRRAGELEVFLVHPGGPFFAKKDEGVWSIPKGEIEEGDDALRTAIREFQEETGIEPSGDLIELGTVKQKAGKVVHAWAFEGNYDGDKPIKSNTFFMEWPPRSGKQQEFPEIDKGAFFSTAVAKQKINSAQAEFVERLQRKFGTGP
jgi:predicted NUDIX family NTP pyrophosphohydrolase